jgi:hypothetical protein
MASVGAAEQHRRLRLENHSGVTANAERDTRCHPSDAASRTAQRQQPRRPHLALLRETPPLPSRLYVNRRGERRARAPGSNDRVSARKKDEAQTRQGV